MISLRASRVNAGYTIKEVANETGHSEKTISKWERGITAIPTHTFYKLCDIYEMDQNLVEVPIVEDGNYDD